LIFVSLRLNRVNWLFPNNHTFVSEICFERQVRLAVE
jgi:hypothetical protein